MNRLAVSYAFNCSHQAADGGELIGTDELIFLLAIAWRIPSRTRFETEPTTLHVLHDLTRLSNRKLRDVRERLEQLGEIRQGGSERATWAKHAVYQLPGLAGPLFVVGPWDVDRETRHSVPRSGGETRHGVPGLEKNAAQRAAKSRHSVPRSGLRAGGVPFSVLPSTSTDHHDDDGLRAGGLLADAAVVAAEELYARLVAEHPAHNNGALLTVSKTSALGVLTKLLDTGRTPDRIFEMAVKLWTCTGAEPGCGWIATGTDRSLQVLWRARDTLDQLVSRPKPAAKAPAACLYRHSPPCASAHACRQREARLIQERDRAEATG